MTNFEAWSNCIGHSGEGGSSDLVETSSLGQMSWARGLALFVGLLDLSAVPKPKEQSGTTTCAEEISTNLGHVSPRCPLQTYALRFCEWLQWIPVFRTESDKRSPGIER